MTSEGVPLAFFDVAAILDGVTEAPRGGTSDVSYELAALEGAREVEATLRSRIAQLEGSASFRVTAPMRRLKSVWSHPRR